jgi:DNA-binding winged helix-turn-helix (wHTH) protein/tetratricopeptide (TPR) repeat protein
VRNGRPGRRVRIGSDRKIDELPGVVPTIYHFDDFRLDPAARELWRKDSLVDMARRTFDGLVFLVEHRDRAISRDELIDALWGRPIEDIQVTQLIMRLRRALGDDSQEPRFIRAVPGFGYRWIAEVQVPALPDAATASAAAGAHDLPENDATAAAVSMPVPPDPSVPDPRAASGTSMEPSAPTQASTDEGAAKQASAAGGAGTQASTNADTEAEAKRTPTAGARRSPALPATLALIVLALAVAAAWLLYARPWEQVVQRAPGDAIVVLPLEIAAGEGTDASWARLGAMDLIAGRMRDAGLPVPPSENVISALQALGSDVDPMPALRDALGAAIVVHGAVQRRGDGWVVDLSATGADGRLRRIESDPGEIIPAARHAADRLLAALGHPAPVPEGASEALSERLQRARAAALALELDTARAILGDAPASLRDEPELRQELAWMELRTGNPAAALSITAGLLKEDAVAARPRLHAQVLITHGVARVNEAGEWPAGEPYFDAAVSVLDDEPWAPELARALAMRSAARNVLQRFDEAARDLGRARTLFEIGGNRMGMAQVENYSGNLELERGRPSDALGHFRRAIEIDRGLSGVDGMRANLSAMQRAQMQLLMWSDAWDTNEKLWALRDQYEQPADPHRRHSLRMHRVEMLTALGRHREAEALLASGADDTGIPAHGMRYEMELRARLAWQAGDAAQALAWSRRALDIALAEPPAVARRPVELALLHQRASIAVGSPAEAVVTLSAQDDPGLAPAELVARAEWAAHEGEHARAEEHFREAIRQAESRPVPAASVLVADAYVRWLLARGRTAEALAEAGRVARWAEDDFDSALLQLMVLKASGRAEGWALARDRAQRLAGGREIPASLLRFDG